jgi:hypothetical protein
VKYYECSNYGKSCDRTFSFTSESKFAFQLTECDFISSGYTKTSLKFRIFLKLEHTPKRLLRKQETV